MIHYRSTEEIRNVRKGHEDIALKELVETWLQVRNSGLI